MRRKSARSKNRTMRTRSKESCSTEAGTGLCVHAHFTNEMTGMSDGRAEQETERVHVQAGRGTKLLPFPHRTQQNTTAHNHKGLKRSRLRSWL
jgi:hypothetical protein